MVVVCVTRQEHSDRLEMATCGVSPLPPRHFILVFSSWVQIILHSTSFSGAPAGYSVDVIKFFIQIFLVQTDDKKYNMPWKKSQPELNYWNIRTFITKYCPSHFHCIFFQTFSGNSEVRESQPSKKQSVAGHFQRNG